MAKKPLNIKPAITSADPLVRLLFDEMARKGITARELDVMSGGRLRADTILQWRKRADPTIRKVRLALELVGYNVTAIKPITRRPTKPDGLSYLQAALEGKL